MTLAEEYNKLLLDALGEKYNKPRPGIHVSDITLCPRESAFRVLDPKDKTEMQFNFFSSGAAIHAAIQSLFEFTPDRFELEKEVKFGDITGHIDIFDKLKHIPIEAKSARVKQMEQPKEHYIRQLEAYMSLTGADTGMIFVQFLLPSDQSPFKWFEWHMTADQRQNTLSQLQQDAIMLKVGIMEQDPSLVRHINYDLTLNWKCKYCDYAKPCEAMRIKETARVFNAGTISKSEV